MVSSFYTTDIKATSCTCLVYILSKYILISSVVTFSFTLVLIPTANANGTEQAIVNVISPSFTAALKNKSQFKIAILPMENFTVEGDIAYHFRMRLKERLKAKGYTVISNKIVDENLYKLGVAHAGQLKLIPFEKLNELTSTDGFLSGVVEQGSVQHAGVYNGYVFTCSLKLQDREGNVLWSALQNRVAKRRFAIDPINIFLDIVLTDEGGDFKQAVYALADIMLTQLPDGPVQVISSGESLLDMAIETKARGEK